MIYVSAVMRKRGVETQSSWVHGGVCGRRGRRGGEEGGGQQSQRQVKGRSEQSGLTARENRH